MPTRIRGSTNTPAPRPRASAAVSLPLYEPLSYPLKHDSIIALEKIQRGNLNGNFKYLDEQLKSAIQLLTECAEEINDLVAEREEDSKKSFSSSRGPTAEHELQQLEERVNQMTGRMDEHVRKAIDYKQDVDEMKTSMGTTITDARRAVTAPVLASQRAQRFNGGGELDEEEEPSTTQLDQSQIVVDPASAPTARFNALLTNAREDYQLKSLRIRYSEHPDYVSFKQSTYSARYGLEAEIPHASTWFNDGRASPAPGTAAADGGAESDDDLQMIRVKISTKCPLTLTEMQNPMSSKVCKHVFEKSAIESYITTVEPGYRGPRNIKTCPVAGCVQKIRLTDLEVDPLMVRRIKRIQAAREREQTQAMEMDKEDESGEDWAKVDEDEEEEQDEDIMDED
jgi:E3 SUMO-protein ligase NSE2